jgi:hypothetical protein
MGSEWIVKIWLNYGRFSYKKHNVGKEYKERD